jgi:hypothetical protein
MNWNYMVGDDRMRFCNQCNLNVYNISAMTKSEAESFIANAEGRICARFYRRADGTVLTHDCPVGMRAVRKKVSRAAATAFSALISLFGGSAIFAQQSKSEAKVDVQRTRRREGQAAIEGKVFDLTRVGIPGSQITLINERTKREITTKANDIGKFRFSDLERGMYTIQVYREGFRKLELLRLEVTDEQSLNLDVTLDVGQIVGELLILPPEPIPTNDTIPSGELRRKDKPRE